MRFGNRFVASAIGAIALSLPASATKAAVIAPGFAQACTPGSGITSVAGSLSDFLFGYLSTSQGTCQIGNLLFSFPDNTTGVWSLLLEANATIGFQQFANTSSNGVSLSMSGLQGILFPGTTISYSVSQNPPSNQPPQNFEQFSVLATGSGGFNPAAITGRVITNSLALPTGIPACPPFEAAVGQGEVFCTVPPGTNQLSMEQILPDGLESSNPEGPSFTTTFYSPPTDQPQPGSSPDIPLLPPPPQTSNEPWLFPPVTVTNPDQVWWFDPEVAIGFIYNVADPAGPLFDQYTAPDLPFNDTYELLSAGGNACSTNPGDYLTPLAVITQNVPYDFATALPCFAIRGIDPANSLDPLNPLAFLAGISFDRAGLVSVSQSPITSNAMPGPLPLFGAGMAWQWSRALRLRQKRS